MVALQRAAGLSPVDRSVTDRLILPARCRQHAEQIHLRSSWHMKAPNSASTMNDITITCPKCGAEVPLSEAVSHRIREQLARDFDQKRRENEGALAARELKLRESQSALEQQQRVLDDEVERRLTAQKQQLLAAATRQAEDKLGLQVKDLQGQVAEQRQKLTDAQSAELDL